MTHRTCCILTQLDILTLHNLPVLPVFVTQLHRLPGVVVVKTDPCCGGKNWAGCENGIASLYVRPQ